MAELIRVDDPLGACAVAVVSALVAADSARGRARLAIPGGSALACVGAIRAQLDTGVWSRLALTWSDERCVSFADQDSSRGAAYRDGHLDRAAPCADELPLYLDGESPEAAVARVLRGLDRWGGLDVALLGLGPDGHVASLFPGHPALRSTARAVHVGDAPKPPPSRISLTLGVFAEAQVFVFARGADKRAAVEGVLTQSGTSPLDHLSNVKLFTDGSTR